jgi:hypothetical protein
LFKFMMWIILTHRTEKFGTAFRIMFLVIPACGQPRPLLNTLTRFVVCLFLDFAKSSMILDYGGGVNTLSKHISAEAEMCLRYKCI